MTIRDGLQFLESSFDFADLGGCFGGSSSGWSDLDGFTERNGALLFVERKLNQPRGSLSRAAIMAHKSMVAQHHNNMVITFWADGGGLGIQCACGRHLTRNAPLVVRHLAVRDNYGEDGAVRPGDLYDLRKQVMTWWDRANGDPRP